MRCISVYSPANFACPPFIDKLLVTLHWAESDYRGWIMCLLSIVAITRQQAWPASYFEYSTTHVILLLHPAGKIIKSLLGQMTIPISRHPWVLLFSFHWANDRGSISVMEHRWIVKLQRLQYSQNFCLHFILLSSLCPNLKY